MSPVWAQRQLTEHWVLSKLDVLLVIVEKGYRIKELRVYTKK